MIPASNRRFGAGIQGLQDLRSTRPVTGAGATRSHPMIGQTADGFERLLKALGIKLDDIKDPTARLADRVAKLREALARDPGLADRLREQFPEAVATLEKLRDVLLAIRPQLSPEEAKVVDEAVLTIESLSASTVKPTGGPLD